MRFNVTAPGTPPPPPPPGSALGGLMSDLSSGGGAGSGTAYMPQQQSEPNVWLGKTTVTSTRPGGNKPLPGGGRLPTTQQTQGDLNLPLSEAQNYPYTLDDATLAKMTERAWYLGYKEVATPQDINGFISLWQAAVAEAAQWQAGGHRLTPMQVLEKGAGGNASTRAERAFAGGTRVQKDRHINLTDPVSAKALVRQAIFTAYGRGPTDAEMNTLIAALTAAEKANPQVSSTSTTYDANGQPVGTPTTTTSGGIDPQAFLESQVQNDPEAKQFQAATTYFPALMQVLGAPAGL